MNKNISTVIIVSVLMVMISLIIIVDIICDAYINTPSEFTFNINVSSDNQSKEIFNSIENINNYDNTIYCDNEKLKIYNTYLVTGTLNKEDLNLLSD